MKEDFLYVRKGKKDKKIKEFKMQRKKEKMKCI